MHFGQKIVPVLLLVMAMVSCGRATAPKPYGYYRITVPDTAYTDFAALYPRYPYSFALSQNAQVQPRTDEPYWINIYYPALDATIHCSYKPVQHNLRELTNDALEFVYRNASFANAIPEREYSHPEAQVYGVLFPRRKHRVLLPVLYHRLHEKLFPCFGLLQLSAECGLPRAGI